jgi:peptidoglycan/LPS O-acetylase OafA/YrhL
MNDSSTPPVAAPQRLESIGVVRGVAALYIYAHHFFREFDLESVVRYLVFGQVVVMIFLIMSGFTLHLSVLRRGSQLGFTQFMLRRWQRLYPLFAICLAFSYLVACVIQSAWADPRWTELAGNLALLQDLTAAGNIVAPYWENIPIWFLSYEWYVVLLYALLMLVVFRQLGWNQRQNMQRMLVLLISFSAILVDKHAPNLFLHFGAFLIVMWAGVELAQEYSYKARITWRGQWFTLVTLAVGACLWCWDLDWRSLDLRVFPGYFFRQFASAFGVVLVTLCFVTVKRMIKLPKTEGLTIQRAFLYLGTISYSMYVLHVPLIKLLHYQLGHGAWLPSFFLGLALLILAGHWLERKWHL